MIGLHMRRVFQLKSGLQSGGVGWNYKFRRYSGSQVSQYNENQCNQMYQQKTIPNHRGTLISPECTRSVHQIEHIASLSGGGRIQRQFKMLVSIPTMYYCTLINRNNYNACHRSKLHTSASIWSDLKVSQSRRQFRRTKSITSEVKRSPNKRNAELFNTQDNYESNDLPEYNITTDDKHINSNTPKRYQGKHSANYQNSYRETKFRERKWHKTEDDDVICASKDKHINSNTPKKYQGKCSANYQNSYRETNFSERKLHKTEDDDDVICASNDKNINSNTPKKYQSKYSANYQNSYRDTKQFSERKLHETEDDDVMCEDSGQSEDASDVFGTLSTELNNRRHPEDELSYINQEDEELVLQRGRRNTPIWYGNQMKKLIKNGKLKEALEMLEVRMLKTDKVQPTEFNYDVLIGGCGRAGYTKKAFKLFNDMKRRGLMPSDVTYTALINACAESPWPTTDGLTRLTRLTELLQAKSIKLNEISYRALIKAYTQCGDILLAFNAFDEMLAAGYTYVVDSFNVLLMACIGEKEAGFRMAIQVWRQMLARNIQPTTNTYNLLLRAARDCGIGDVETANQILLKSPPITGDERRKGKVKVISSRNSKKSKPTLRSDEGNEEIGDVATTTNDMVTLKPIDIIDDENPRPSDNNKKLWWQHKDAAMDTTDVALYGRSDGNLVGITVPFGLPNLLDLTPKLNNVETLNECTSADTRLALIGGVCGVIERMKQHNAKPNIKTYTILLDSVPMTLKAEIELMVAMDTEGVVGDISFYNAIIRRRSKRNDLKSAKMIVPVITSKGLYPDLRTYVNLACACFRKEDGLQLLREVKAAGLVANVYLYGALINAARRKRDYSYLTEIMKSMKANDVKPNEVIIRQLELAAAFTTDIGRGFKRKLEPQYAKIQGFRGYYSEWLEEMETEMEEHPWHKFKSVENTGEEYNWREEQ
ncbi:pentatricopeptide repeat-containing protein 1, mitochondrial-like [Glandiceps talaboti]